MKEQIRSMLAAGLAQTQVAQAVGCEDSYVAQLMMDPEFAGSVASARAVRTAKFLEADDDLDAAESMALKRTKMLIPMITKPLEAAAVFSKLNAARRRAEVGAANAQQDGADTVTLTLPRGVTANVAIQISSDRQVVEVEGRSMATMQARTLAQRLEDRRAKETLETVVPKKLTLANSL